MGKTLPPWMPLQVLKGKGKGQKSKTREKQQLEALLTSPPNQPARQYGASTRSTPTTSGADP